MYSRQPNGLYCRFSTVVDNFTHCNLTEDDLIERLGEPDTRYLLSFPVGVDFHSFHLWPFDYIKTRIRPDNDTLENVRKLLRKMGDDDWENFEYEIW